MNRLTDADVDRALDVWREEADVAYAARISNYLHPDGTPDRAALQLADIEAERLNRDLMRRAIEAALTSARRRVGA